MHRSLGISHNPPLNTLLAFALWGLSLSPVVCAHAQTPPVPAASGPSGLYRTNLLAGKTVTVAPGDDRVKLRVQDAPETALAQGGPSLAFSVNGSNLWAVGAWQWWGNAGREIAAPEWLIVRLRVVGTVPPDASVSVALTGPTLDTESAQKRPRSAASSVRLSTYDDTWADGSWHTLTIPVADLLASPNGLDTARIDGLTLSVWVAEAPALFTVFLASAEFSPPPPPKPAPLPPPVTPAEKKRQARLEAVRAQAARIRPGMLRSEVELLFPARDPLFEHPERTRYDSGDGIVIEVSYDATGGPNNRENRVKGEAKVFAGKTGK